MPHFVIHDYTEGSSSILQLGYSIQSSLLFVVFKQVGCESAEEIEDDTPVYLYESFPEPLYQEIINAESIGSTFNKSCRDNEITYSEKTTYGAIFTTQDYTTINEAIRELAQSNTSASMYF